jgi:hypothetical protein
MPSNCHTVVRTVRQLSQQLSEMPNNCHTVVRTVRQLSELSNNCQNYQTTVTTAVRNAKQLSYSCQNCQATVTTAVRNAKQLPYSCQKCQSTVRNPKQLSEMSNNCHTAVKKLPHFCTKSPSLFGRGKSIYKPSHFWAKLVRTQVPFLLSPLHSSPLYPPARD